MLMMIAVKLKSESFAAPFSIQCSGLFKLWNNAESFISSQVYRYIVSRVIVAGVGMLVAALYDKRNLVKTPIVLEPPVFTTLPKYIECTIVTADFS